MNMYRRNDFKSWFADVGIIYLIVVGFVTLVFSVGSLRQLSASWNHVSSADVTAHLQAGAYGSGTKEK